VKQLIAYPDKCTGCGACRIAEPYCGCDECGGPIYEGDFFYPLYGDNICEECMENARRTAG
jgi:hypothetical protein